MAWSIPKISLRPPETALARRALELGHAAGFLHTGLEPHRAREILRASGWSISKIQKLERKASR